MPANNSRNLKASLRDFWGTYVAMFRSAMSVPQALSILDFPAVPTEDELGKRFRQLTVRHHPDKGGDTAQFAQMSAAYTLLKKFLSTNETVSSPPAPSRDLMKDAVAGALKAFLSWFREESTATKERLNPMVGQTDLKILLKRKLGSVINVIQADLDEEQSTAAPWKEANKLCYAIEAQIAETVLIYDRMREDDEFGDQIAILSLWSTHSYVEKLSEALNKLTGLVRKLVTLCNLEHGSEGVDNLPSHFDDMLFKQWDRLNEYDRHFKKWVPQNTEHLGRFEAEVKRRLAVLKKDVEGLSPSLWPFDYAGDMDAAAVEALIEKVRRA